MGRHLFEHLKEDASSMKNLSPTALRQVNEWLGEGCLKSASDYMESACECRLTGLDAMHRYHTVWFGYSASSASQYFDGGPTNRECLRDQVREGHAIAILGSDPGTIRVIGLTKDERLDFTFSLEDMIPNDCTSGCPSRVMEAVVRYTYEKGVILMQHECGNPNNIFDQVMEAVMKNEGGKNLICDLDLSKKPDDAFERVMLKEKMLRTTDLKAIRDAHVAMFQTQIDAAEEGTFTIVLNLYCLDPFALETEVNGTRYLILGDGFFLDDMMRALREKKVKYTIDELHETDSVISRAIAGMGGNVPDYREKLRGEAWLAFYGMSNSIPFVN